MPASQPPNKTQIKVVKQDILSFEGSGILLPTISTGEMRLGFAAHLKEILGSAGRAIEQQAMAHAPIAVGAAYVTPLKEHKAIHFHYLIHVPVVEDGALKVGVENIRRAARAGLLGAAKFQMEQIAIPGFGYGEGEVPHDEVARAIIDEVKGFKSPVPALVLLMDDNSDMYAAFGAEVGGRVQR